MPTKKYQIRAECFDRKGRSLSVGWNSYTQTHPLQAHFARLVGRPASVYLHAEIAALLRSRGKKVERLTIKSFNGPPPYPCPICQRAIAAFGVRHIEVIS